MLSLSTAAFAPLLLLVSAAGMTADAPSGAPAPAAGRYQLQPVEGGVARLDTATGEVSLCRVDGDAIACQPAMQEKGPVDERLDALERRIGALEGGGSPSKEASRQEGDQAFDRALDQMKRVFRTFKDTVEEFRKDWNRPDGGSGAVPNRT